MAHITSIAYTPEGARPRSADRYDRVSLEHTRLIARHGIEGDAKASRGKRQLNVMLAETIADLEAEGFRTEPGELGEQLVIAGLSPREATTGACLQLGDDAVIELGKLRTPCGRFARVQGQPIELAEGRIGFMARVLADGEITVGSPVKLVEQPQRATA